MRNVVSRNCPHCGALVASGDRSCTCGFSFKAEETQVPAPAIVRGLAPEPADAKPAPAAGRQPNAAMLMSCPGCEARISKRAARCPKCGGSPYNHCKICATLILTNAVPCPECGDPAPFDA
jgi:hypothetical protein